jgi:hypothetical protein
MKKLILLLSVALSFNSFAATLQTVKVSDGKVAHCKTKYDMNRNKLGAYTLKASSAEIVEETISMKLKVSFFKCVENNGRLGFSYALPFETTNWTTGDQDASALVNSVKLKAYQDGVYKVLFDQELTDESRQNIEFSTDFSSLVSEDEIQAIESGVAVIKSIDFSLVKNINIISGDLDMTSNRSFGSFRVRISLEKSAEGIKVRQL